MPRKKPGTGPKPQIVPPERDGRGDPKPLADAVEPLAPALIKRLKDELIPRAKDQRLGSVLGLMHLEGILTEVEVEAGFKYAEDVGAYERSHGYPRRSARSASWDAGYGRAELDLDALKRMDPETADKIARKIMRHRKAVDKRYDRAQACVPSLPVIASTVIDDVCCNDRPVNSVHHAGLKKILRNLAKHYGLVTTTASEGLRSVSKRADAAIKAARG